MRGILQCLARVVSVLSFRPPGGRVGRADSSSWVRSAATSRFVPSGLTEGRHRCADVRAGMLLRKGAPGVSVRRTIRLGLRDGEKAMHLSVPGPRTDRTRARTS